MRVQGDLEYILYTAEGLRKDFVGDFGLLVKAVLLGNAGVGKRIILRIELGTTNGMRVSVAVLG
jgi:hypothetical protein